jgi:hypothetical protein
MFIYAKYKNDASECSSRLFYWYYLWCRLLMSEWANDKWNECRNSRVKRKKKTELFFWIDAFGLKRVKNRFTEKIVFTSKSRWNNTMKRLWKKQHLIPTSDVYIVLSESRSYNAQHHQSFVLLLTSIQAEHIPKKKLWER